MSENVLLTIRDIVAIGTFVIYMLHVPRFLHIMQLESYHDKDYFNWLIKNGKKAFKLGAIQFLIYALVLMVVYVLTKHINIVATIYTIVGIYVALMLAFIIPNVVILFRAKKDRKNAKKPLKYTARVIRLYFSNFLIVILLRALFADHLGWAIHSTLLIYSFLIFWGEKLI